MFPNMDSKS